MITKQVIDDFFKQKRYAVVGVSRNPKKFSSAVYREMKAKGFEVYPVNSRAEKVEQDPCYPDLKSIPHQIDAVVVLVPPHEAEKVVQDSSTLGIPYIWLQQGTESESILNFCREKKIQVIHHHCIFMFLEPITGGHAVHRWFAKLFRKVPT
ncbi:MAG: CoA-binding protein [bacterium]